MGFHCHFVSMCATSLRTIAGENIRVIYSEYAVSVKCLSVLSFANHKFVYQWIHISETFCQILL